MEKDHPTSVSLEPSISCGIITISPPRGWREVRHDYFSTSGNRWTRSFISADCQDSVITLHYRGHPLDLKNTVLIRRTLLMGPSSLFDRLNHSPDEAALAAGFVKILGNAGHNQASNQQTGVMGPAYRLDKLRVQELNKRCVLLVQGAYLALDGGMISLDYGVLIDATPLSRQAHLQEIHLQAPPGMSHEMLVTQFECMLSSTVWHK